MPYLSLTLNGYPVDLPADAAVALSYRANDLRNLDSREAAFSESFTLPLTARNVAVLGQPHALDSLTTTPYRPLPAVLTSPGGAVVLDGFAILESSGEGYEVTLTDAIGSLFSQVGDKPLRALDLSQYDHVLSYANQQSSQAHAYTQGYTYPLADLGMLPPRTPQQGLAIDEVPVAVFYHAILSAIVAESLPGFRARGSLLADGTYQRAVLPQATGYLQLRKKYLAPYTMRALITTARTYSRQTVDIPFDLVQQGSLAANTYYTPPPHPIGFKLEFKLPLNYVSPSSLVVANFVICADDSGGVNPPVLLAGQGANVQGDRVLTLTAEVPYVALNAASRLFLRLSFAGLGGGVALTLKPGGSLKITPLPRALPGAPVHLDASLPDMSQADFLKLAFNQFNIITQAETVYKVVRFDLFNDLERNRNQAVDWTSKLDFTSRPRLSYALGDYAQQNGLAYGELPGAYTDELYLFPAPYDDADRGRESLPVLNANLPAVKEAYAADVFLPLGHTAASQSQEVAWLPFFTAKDTNGVAVFPYDPTLEYERNTGIVRYQGRFWQSTKIRAFGQPYAQKPPRADSPDWDIFPNEDFYEASEDALASVALLVPYVAAEPVRVHSDGSSYFIPARTLTRDGLSFGELLPAYYPGLVNILQRVQVLTLDIRLTALDIANLDFVRPVRLDVPHAQSYGKLSCLAYLNDIAQYIPSEPGAVECTFLVLGAPVAGLAPRVPNPPVRPLRILVTQAGQLLATEDGYLILAEY